jgi:hypothetical protein
VLTNNPKKLVGPEEAGPRVVVAFARGADDRGERRISATKT